MPSLRSFGAKAAVVLLSGLFAFGVAEFLLRYWLHAVPQLELDLYQRDPEGNLLLRPGITRRHVTRLWDVVIRTNSEGWRGDEPPAQAPPPTILGLGDSMAFGWGVNVEESFLSLLEDRLNHELPARIVNAAVPGTGPTDQLRLLESIAPRFEPRAVILSLFVGNDFVDVQMGGAAQFDVEDGLLVRRALNGETVSSLAAARSWLVRRSHLLQLVRAVQLNRSREGSPSSSGDRPRHWDEWMREFAQIHLKDYPERTQRAVEETLRCLDGFDAFCRSRLIPFILMVIPRSYQVYPGERSELIRALNISESGLDLDRPQHILGEWASQRNVPMVDLLPAFRAHQQGHPGDDLFHYPDAHMTSLGHRVAAEAITAAQGVTAAILESLSPEPQEAASIGLAPQAAETPLQ